MQQLGCESHSVTCVSCYVHVYGNKVIIIIIIINAVFSWVLFMSENVTGIDTRPKLVMFTHMMCCLDLGRPRGT